MNDEASSGGTDAAEQTEPKVATEQTESKSESWQDVLIKAAQEDGIPVAGEPPREIGEKDEEPEPVAAIADETVEEPEPGSDEPDEDEEPVEAKEHKGDKLVPLREVLKERQKKERFKERAEKAEIAAQQLQAELAKASAPRPTADNKFADIQDLNQLETLKKSYDEAVDYLDRAIDKAETEGGAEVVVGVVDGKPVKDTLDYATLKERKREAERSLRTLIPEREKYLTLRAQATADAIEVYPQLKDIESEFTQQAGTLAFNIATGRAMNQADVLLWCADAVAGRNARLAVNGQNGAVKSKEAKKIIESSKQKIAPTPTRTRTVMERGRGTADLEKVQAEFNQRGDVDSATKLVGAILSQKGSDRTRRLVPVSE